MITPYEKFKGFLLAILLGIIVYVTLHGVRLAERYIEAKEIETRYEIVQGVKFFIVDKKEFKIYMSTKDGNFIPCDYNKM